MRAWLGARMLEDRGLWSAAGGFPRPAWLLAEIASRESPVSTFSPRVPHLFTRPVLARLLTPTYAGAMDVDEDEAHERLLQALEVRSVMDDVLRGLGEALAQQQGPRTSADKFLDRISGALEKRSGRVRPAPSTPAVAAVLVRLNLELGLAPEPMRATLASPRGAAVLEKGLGDLGAHLVKELLR